MTQPVSAVRKAIANGLESERTPGAESGVDMGVVAAPRHTAELVRLVQNARRRGTPLAVTSARPPPSRDSSRCWVDLSGWNRVESPNCERLTVVAEPGATLRRVLERTLPLGLAPKALGLDLDVTIGGTLSGGGVGGTSHRHGLSASQVAYAQVVLGNGDVVHTSPEFERDVYDSVFGGAGRFGVITSVELELERIPALVRSYSLRYDDCRVLASDMLRLSSHAGVRSLVALNDETAPRTLRVTIDEEADGCFALPRGLGYQALLEPERQSFEQFLRLDDHVFRRPTPGESGSAMFGAFLPETGALPMLLEHAFDCTSPLPARVVVVSGAGLPAAIAFPGTPRALAFVTPGGVEQFAGEVSETLRALQQRLYRAGGRLFSTSVGIRRDPGFWRAHYANTYKRIAMLKRWFDPADILTSEAGALR